MCRLLVFILLGLLSCELEAQTYFEKYLDGGLRDIGIAVVAFPNGNLAIAGVSARANGINQGFLMNYDTANDTFNFWFLDEEKRSSLMLLSNTGTGKAIAGGMVAPTPRRDDWLVYEMTSSGVVQPMVRFGEMFVDEELRGLIVLPDGGFVGTGGYSTQNIGMVSRFDNEGNELWSTGFTSANSRFNIFGGARQIGDDYLVTGIVDDTQINWSLLLVSLTETGSLNWSKKYEILRWRIVRKPVILACVSIIVGEEKFIPETALLAGTVRIPSLK